MAAWAWLAIAGAILALAGLALGGLALWRHTERTSILNLIGRREELAAARKSLEETIELLADADNRTLMRFETDREDVNRRALSDAAAQAALLRDELDTKALPARVIPAAEALADAAWYLEAEVARLGGNQRVSEIRESLAAVNLGQFDAALIDADRSLSEACAQCQIQDKSVYGGGLYV